MKKKARIKIIAFLMEARLLNFFPTDRPMTNRESEDFPRKGNSLHIIGYELFPFGLQAKELMESYLKKLNLDISDYSFAANYLWMSQASGFYAIIHDTFCLFALSGGELSMILPPLGEKNQVFEAMSVCFELMNANNSSKNYSRIDYVHESLLEGFVDYLEEGTEIFEMLQDYLVERKLVDYVYHSDMLIRLSGSDFSSKRNEINKFQRIHPGYRIEKLDIHTHAQAVANLFHKWILDRMRFLPREEIESFMDGIYLERLAIKRLLRDYEALQLIGIVLIIDDDIKGFTVGEQINSNTASVIIEKTDFEILGAAQFIFREFSRILQEEFQVEYINVGDDMGFENLRKVKLSYRPIKLIPKYTIYQK